jgi:hypothetical protein
MEFTNEDEIEYFGFLSISFTTDLREELNDNLNDIFNNYHLHNKIQTHISESFKKNYFIFNNFVLRNILKFPNNFKLERKITDKSIETDSNEMIIKIVEKQKKLLEIKNKIQRLEEKVEFEKNKANGYKNLLKNKSQFYDLVTGAKEIKIFLKETNVLYEKYKTGAKRKDSEFEKLMEYKNIKNEYFKAERSKLLEISDFETLEHLNKNI